MNERGDWEPGEDLFKKLGGISSGGGGGSGSEEDSSDDDGDDDDAGSSPRDGEAEGAGNKKDKEGGGSGGGFYEGPEACREYLGERERAGRWLREKHKTALSTTRVGGFIYCVLIGVQ